MKQTKETNKTFLTHTQSSAPQKSAFSFYSFTLASEIWPFYPSKTFCLCVRKKLKMVISQKKSKTKQTKGTLTFKVGENNVVLLFPVLPHIMRYNLYCGGQKGNSFHGKLTILFSNIIIFPYFLVSFLPWKIISF